MEKRFAPSTLMVVLALSCGPLVHAQQLTVQADTGKQVINLSAFIDLPVSSA